jgi:hypothetical protein
VSLIDDIPHYERKVADRYDGGSWLWGIICLFKGHGWFPLSETTDRCVCCGARTHYHIERGYLFDGRAGR